MKKIVLGYGAAAAFSFIFQLIYSRFSHGVNSFYMTYAFLIPFIGGILSVVGLFLWGKKSNSPFQQLVCGSTIWFTLGSIFKGALEIYGTTNHLTVVFTILGFSQLAVAFFTILEKKKI